MWRVLPGRVTRRHGSSIDGSNLAQDLLDFRRRDNRFARPEKSQAFFRDRLLEVPNDLGLVRIAAELRVRMIEIGAECVVSALVELIRIAVEIDRDDFLHDYARPRLSNV